MIKNTSQCVRRYSIYNQLFKTPCPQYCNILKGSIHCLVCQPVRWFQLTGDIFFRVTVGLTAASWVCVVVLSLPNLSRRLKPSLGTVGLRFYHVLLIFRYQTEKCSVSEKSESCFHRLHNFILELLAVFLGFHDAIGIRMFTTKQVDLYYNEITHMWTALDFS